MLRLQLKASYLFSKYKAVLMLALVVLFCFDGTLAFNATSVGDALDNGASQGLQEFARVYCGSVGYLLMAIEGFLFLKSKNDKVKAAALASLVGCFIAYIYLKILSAQGGGAIGTTLDEVTDWVDG